MKRKISIGLLLIGALWRTKGVTASAIWYDEAFSLSMSRLPLRDMLRLQTSDFNPPLWNILLRLFTTWTGKLSAHAQLFLLRVPALFCSLVGLYLAWRLMERLAFNDNQRIMGAALAGLIPGGFWVAQDARVYAWLTMLFLAGALFTIDKQYIMLSVTCVALLYSHNIGVFLVGGLLLLAWYCHHDARAIVSTGTVTGLLWMPWLFGNIIHRAGDFWLPALSADYVMHSVMQAAWAESLPNLTYLYGWWVLLISTLAALGITIGIVAPLLWDTSYGYIYQARAALELIGLKSVAGKLRPPTKPTIVDDNQPIMPLAIMVWTPVLLMVIVSVIWHNVIFYRPFTTLTIPTALWIAAATAPRKWTYTTWALPTWWAGMLLTGLIFWNPAMRGGGLNNAANLIENQWQPGDAVLYVTGTVALPFDFYLPYATHYILGADQNPALLQRPIGDALGYNYATLPQLTNTYRRLWVIWPRDPLISDNINTEINALVSHAQPIGLVRYWQAARIEIYLVEASK